MATVPDYPEAMSDTDATNRESRESVFLSAVVTGFGQPKPTTHRARNVSPNGVCIDRAEMFKPGQTVVVDIGMLEAVGATVRWVTGALAGLKFAHPISIEAAKTRPKPEHVRAGWARVTTVR